MPLMPQRDDKQQSGTARLTRLALLTAIALTIFMVEAQLPVLVPIQGVKLGLANIVTVYAVFALGPGDALLILLSRVFLGAVFSGQMMTLFYSLGGGLLAWLVMCLLRPVFHREHLWLCSPVAALFHKLGQLLVGRIGPGIQAEHFVPVEAVKLLRPSVKEGAAQDLLRGIIILLVI